MVPSMQRTSFGNMQCPVARSLERVGEWWSMLILRDAFAGITRFDDFQHSLGIAPTMLTRRLQTLQPMTHRRPNAARCTSTASVAITMNSPSDARKSQQISRIE